MNNTLTVDSPAVEGFDGLRQIAPKESSLVPTLPTTGNLCPLRGTLVTFAKDVIARSSVNRSLLLFTTWWGYDKKLYASLFSPPTPYHKGLSWAPLRSAHASRVHGVCYVSNLNVMGGCVYAALGVFSSVYWSQATCNLRMGASL